MKKVMLLSLIFVVFLAFGSINVLEDRVSPGDELWWHVNVRNPDKFDLRNVHLRTLVFCEGFESQSVTFDKIDDRSSSSRIFVFDVPEIKPRECVIRFSVSDDKGNRARTHRTFFVV